MKRVYSKKSLSNAKLLRNDATETEQILWHYLRNRGLNNIKFRRQVPIWKYIVDFLCMDKKLIVELDGSEHLENASIEYDNERTKYLENLGYKVIRIYNNDIGKQINAVLEYIYQEYLKL